MVDNFIKMVTVLGPTVVAVLAFFKYIDEKNKDIYIKRLKEVYAPLYSYLIKQETIREYILKDIAGSVKSFPILTYIVEQTKSKLALSDTGLKQEVFEKKEEILLGLDRKKFIEILDDTNKGLVTPNLLVLINEYEVLVHLEEKLDKTHQRYSDVTEKKVEIEYKLYREVVNGYKETISRLGLDFEQNICDPEQLEI